MTTEQIYYIYSVNSKNKVTVYHDLASPFSYLGVSQAKKLISDRGAELILKPVLLGGIFKALNGPNVPLFEMNAAKQKYYLTDLQQWANFWGVPLQFSQAFPLRTVTAQRLLLIKPELTEGLYHAAWGDGIDIGDETWLKAFLLEQGYDAEKLLTGTQSPQIKEQLRANTEEALSRGAFGAPSFYLERPHQEPQLFWGQDRLQLLSEAMA